MAEDAEVSDKQCFLDQNGCVTLRNILIAFNAPINEEHAWALCYQCSKCFKNAILSERERCLLVSELDHVTLHRDGQVHPNTIFAGGGSRGASRILLTSETKLLFCLGTIIWSALDYGLQEYEEKNLSSDLDRLIDIMTSAEGENQIAHQETDDEGIERDSGDNDEESSTHLASFDLVIMHCMDRLGNPSAQQADAHYRAVVRALVAEALELSTFLEKVSQGTNDLRCKTETSSTELDQLQFSDWARLWVQVIRELRNGVKLKKVNYSRTPIEFEMTPYEILMDDIRSRRYKLNKVMVDGNIPHKLKKDAHAIILEFIRSRPPLRKASDRKLRPAVSRPSTPREMLMDSIKQGRALRSSLSPLKKKVVPMDGPPTDMSVTCGGDSQRRLIHVDFSVLQSDEEDEEDVLRFPGGTREARAACRARPEENRYPRTSTLTHDEYHHYCDQALESYDLATQCPSRRASARRHTIMSCESPDRGAVSVPESRPHSPQSAAPTTASQSPGSEELANLGSTLPEMSWSRTSLQEDLFQSKTWAQECLSLTLEEIVHIRSVLTKAELEALPVDGHVKDDVEKRKVCFLCLKTRFSIFGPWGQKCRLCKRTICAKCYSKMRIPTEHFAHVPVVALSPSLLHSPVDEDSDGFPRSLVSRLLVPESRNSVGSAPSSPHLARGESVSAPGSRVESSLDDGPQSLPPGSPASVTSERRGRMARSKTLGRTDPKAERLKGPEMTVCHDCKAMVIQIIKSSRTNRNIAIRNLTLNLSPVY